MDIAAVVRAIVRSVAVAEPIVIHSAAAANYRIRYIVVLTRAAAFSRIVRGAIVERAATWPITVTVWLALCIPRLSRSRLSAD